MKNKILSVLLFFAVVMYTAAVPITVHAADASAYILGDADGNGRVESIDAAYVQSYCAEMRTGLSDNTLMFADVDQSGTLDVTDATFIQRYIAQMKTPYAVGELVAAYDAPTFVVSNVTAAAGKTTDVAISVKNNPGILGMTLTLSYDADALTLTSAASGSAVSDVLAFTKPGRFTSPCNFTWDGIELSEDQIKDGEILILTFRVSDSAAPGSYPITVSFEDGSIIDNDLKPVYATVVNGSIRVG